MGSGVGNQSALVVSEAESVIIRLGANPAGTSRTDQAVGGGANGSSGNHAGREESAGGEVGFGREGNDQWTTNRFRGDSCTFCLQ